MNNKKWIKKASGEMVIFDPEKLKTSLFKAGASPELIAQITQQISEKLTEATTTKSIYKQAYQLLRQDSQKLAGQYKLKTALLEMGPSGYPFEHFVAILLKHQGYQTKVGTHIKGGCLTHEVDILAQNPDEIIIAECKHHSRAGYKSDVKIPLYVHARFQDMVLGDQVQSKKKPMKCAIISNTRFTSDAETYATCYNLQLIAWDYPSKGSLKQRIALSKHYPVTCIHSLTKKDKETLMHEGIVSCQQLYNDNAILSRFDQNKKSRIWSEVQAICQDEGVNK